MAIVEDRFLSWLDSLGIQVAGVTPLPGDVSPRRYFRITKEPGTSAVLAVYPHPGQEASERFLATTRLFGAAGIRVPHVLASDTAQGFVLLEDLGTVSLFDLVGGSWSDLQPLIEEAIGSLKTLAAHPVAEFGQINPPLDTRRLAEELRDAKAVFLGAHEFSGDDFAREALFSVLDKILEALATEPLVPSHRDFMSRNLMLSNTGARLAVIDHQDACLAPRCYDLASLLNDSFFPSLSQEEEFLGRISSGPKELLSYRRCAVQRTLKATATYVRFAVKGCDRRLALVTPTLARAALQLERLPEGNEVPSGIYDRWRDPVSIAEGIDRLLRTAKTRSTS
jgi:aminoglycoside/choline kinase family phosphotransferase